MTRAAVVAAVSAGLVFGGMWTLKAALTDSPASVVPQPDETTT